MKIKNILNILISNTAWIIVITAVSMTILFIISWIIVNAKPLNEELATKQFIYSKLSECREKLGAYGEPEVDFDVSFYTATAEELKECLKKLETYGEPIDPQPK